jgi:hypothetical protein
MNPLTAAAVRAVAQMGFVVQTQIRRDAGDIVTPAREDGTHHLVIAGVVAMSSRAWGQIRHFHLLDDGTRLRVTKEIVPESIA